MDIGGELPAAASTAEADIAAPSSAPTTDSAAASASETLLTPGQESVDTLDKGALSPLTGSYLLIVLAEPHSEEDREIIIKRLIKGLRSWDLDSTHVDLGCELLNLANAAPESDEARNGEKLVQWASENLVVEVLIHCQVNTLLQCMKNLLSSFTRHRHIIHAGYTFSGSGSWILQDGTFSFADFVELWEEPEVTRILAAYRGDISVSIHCAEENGWTDDQLRRESFTKLCQVSSNPGERISGHSSGIITFVDYISKLVQPAPLKEILEPSEIVGNIRFSHPTLYVFPGGQGDCALFGVNGFNMLIDGGFSRHSCFWDFTRHLDRLDAVLLTRVNNNSMAGLDSLMDRKRINQVYPQIGHFFGNVMERKHALTDLEKDTSTSSGELLVSLTETGARILDNLKNINLRPQHCFREHTIDPVNLYHKVGHGKLDMYVLNPAKDSREVKEFLSKWNTDCKSFVQAKLNVKVEGKENNYPVLNLVSICALLVWQPNNPKEPITRILFPGSTPQQKIFEALGKLKHLEFLKYPICSAKTLAASHKSRAKSERIVSEARAHLRSGDTPSESAKVSRAPSESRVTSSSRYSSTLYSGVKSKVTSSQRSDSSTTIQTAEEKDKEKERKGRERSREKRKITSSSSTTREAKDNKMVEEVKKSASSSLTTSKNRVESGIKSSTASTTTARSRSKSKSKVPSKPRIDSGVKKIAPSDVTSPPSAVAPKESTGNIKKSTSTSKYGIGTTLTGRTVVSKSTASVPGSGAATPPKSAKDATNRKVIEHKAAQSSTNTRKSLLDKNKESAVKSTSVITTSSKPPPAPKSKTSNSSQRPSTATAASRKAGSAQPSGNAIPVKRPGTAKAIAATTGVAAAGIAAAAAVVASMGEKGEPDDKMETSQEPDEFDKLATDDNDTMDKDSIEEELIIEPHTNGLGLSSSVPVTESSSELSSLEHVIDYEVETEEGERNGHSHSSRAELSEEVSGSEDIDTVESKTGYIVAPESETHTITEPGHEGEMQDAGYDEEDEYLIVEKDESAGGEEIGIDGGGGISNESYHEEKGVVEEKDVIKGESEGEIIEEESSIPEVERARKSMDLSNTESGQLDGEIHIATEEITKTGSASEMKLLHEYADDKLDDQKVEESILPTEEEQKQPSSSPQRSQDEMKLPAESKLTGKDEGLPDSPPPSPDNKDQLVGTAKTENEGEPPSPSPSMDKEITSAISFSNLEKQIEDQIDNAKSLEEISQDINTFEKTMDETTLSKFEEKVELRGEDDDEEEKSKPTLFENKEKEETLVKSLKDDDVVLEVLKLEDGISELEKVEESKLDSQDEEEPRNGSNLATVGTESLSVPGEKIVSHSPNEGEGDMCDDKHSTTHLVEEKIIEAKELLVENNAYQASDLPLTQDANVDDTEEPVADSVDILDVSTKSHEPKETIISSDPTTKAQETIDERRESLEGDRVVEHEEMKGNESDAEAIKEKDVDDDKHSIKSDARDEDRHSIASLSPAGSVEEIKRKKSQDVGGMSKSMEKVEKDDKLSTHFDADKQSVGSISPAMSVEDVKENIKIDEDDKHSVKSESSGIDKPLDNKHSDASVSPAPSIEEVPISEMPKVLGSVHSLILDDDKHSVKSESGSHHDDKHSVGSISPARSIENVKVLSKPLDEDNDKHSTKGEVEPSHDDKHSVTSLSPSRSIEDMNKPLEEDDKHSVKSGTGSRHDDKHSVGSISPARSVEDVKITDVSKDKEEDDDKHCEKSISSSHATEAAIQPTNDDEEDKHSVKSEISNADKHFDKLSIGSASPARSQEDLKEIIKPSDDDKHSIGSISPVRSVEDLKHPGPEAISDLLERKFSTSSIQSNQEATPLDEEDKHSIKSLGEKEDNDKASPGELTEPEPSTEQFDLVVTDKPLSSAGTAQPTRHDEKQAESSPPLDNTNSNVKPDSDNSPLKMVAECELSHSEEGRPSSTEIDFDTEILPSEALALVQLGEKLITQGQKNEVAAIIASSSSDPVPEIDQVDNAITQSKIKALEQIGSVHLPQEKAAGEGEISSDLLISPSISQQEIQKSNKKTEQLITDHATQELSSQIESKSQTLPQEKESNAHESDKSKTEDKKVPAKSEEQFSTENPEKDTSSSAQQQRSELSLVETDNDPVSAVFSPGDSEIRTEELDLALEEHRRRLSAANSQVMDIIMGNMSEDKVDIETSRESQFGSVNEEPDVDEKDWGDEDEQPKLHFNTDGDEVGANDEDVQTPIVATGPIPQGFKESSNEHETKLDKKEIDFANKQRPNITPSAIPSSKFPRESKEVIRTPDEVADLPMHEEVDPGTYKEDESDTKIEDGFPSSSSKSFTAEELTTSVPNTQTTTTTFTTTSITTTHTTKDEESPAPEIDSAPYGGIGSCESESGKLALHDEKSGDEQDFKQVDKQLPKEQKVEGTTMSIVEKIDAAVSPVLESLLTKSVEKSLELNQQPELSRIEESDKYSDTTSAAPAMQKRSAKSGVEISRTEEGENGENAQIEAQATETGPLYEEQVDSRVEDDGLQNLDQEQLQDTPQTQLATMKFTTATTSVVITPSTPPVIPSTTREQTDSSFHYEDGEAEIRKDIKQREQLVTLKDDMLVKNDNDKLQEETMIAKDPVTTTTSPQNKLILEEKSDESSTSSALTTVATGKSENASSGHVAPTEDETPKKLFFLPRDEDDDDDVEDNEQEGQGASAEQEGNLAGGISNVIETVLLNAAATVSAVAVHQNPENVATFSSQEREISPSQETEIKSASVTDIQTTDKFLKDKVGISREADSDIDVLLPTTTSTQDEHEHSAESEKDKTTLKSDFGIKNESTPLITGHESPTLNVSQDKCQLDLQQESECQFHSEEDTGLATSQKESIYGSESEMKSPKSSSTGAKFDHPEEKAGESEEVIKLDEGEGEGEDRSNPISITSSLLETAHSAVFSAVQTATETLDVAHSTVEEVEKSAVDRVDNLLNEEKQAKKQGSDCPKASCVAGVEDKICDSMKGGIRKKCDDNHEHDDENDGPEVVEEICVKSTAPKPIIPDHFYVEDDSGLSIVEEEVHLVLRKEVKSGDGTQIEISVKKLQNIDDTNLVADLEAHMVNVEEKTHQQLQQDDEHIDKIPSPKEQKEPTLPGPEHIKSSLMDFDDSAPPTESSKLSSSTMQIVEEEQKNVQVKKRKQLSDYIETIREAKAVFENLLKIAKSGATLSSAVEECKENAQEAIRRHLEAADEVYKPANKDPECCDVPDSPEPEMGITVYESLEQMAKAGAELFSGLVEKVEKEIEEKAKAGEDDSDKPTEDEDPEEPDGVPREERRTSAELAVTAALQHLHETFKTMQTLGSSPKRSSSTAARRMQCHHHAHDHEHHCSHSHESQPEDELSSATSSSAIFSTGISSALHLSASDGGESTTMVKSPDDGSEGETMRESLASFAESGVASQSDADDAIIPNKSHTVKPGQKSDEDSPKSKSEETTTVIMSSSFISGSDFEHGSERVEKHGESSESKDEAVITNTGHFLSKSDSASKSGQVESNEFSKLTSTTGDLSVSQTKSAEFNSSSEKKLEQEEQQLGESSYSKIAISSSSGTTAAELEFVSRKISSATTESGGIIRSEQMKVSEEEVRNLESSSSHTISSSSFKQLGDSEQFLSRYEDSSAQMYKDEFGDGSFRRFSSVDDSSHGTKVATTTKDQSAEAGGNPESKLSRRASEAQGSAHYGDNFEFAYGEDNKGFQLQDEEEGKAISDVGYVSHAEVEDSEMKAEDNLYSTTTVTKSENPIDGSTTTTTVTKIITKDLDGSGSSQVLETTETKSGSGFDESLKQHKDQLFGDSSTSGPFSFIGGVSPGVVTTTVTKTISGSDGNEGLLKSEKVTTTTHISNTGTTEGFPPEMLSSIPPDIAKQYNISSSSSSAFHQEEEPYSSGDFTDSQPSSIPTQQTETDEEVHNFDIPPSDKTTTVITTTADIDNGNYSTTTTTTTTTNSNKDDKDNGTLTTQRVVTTTTSIVQGDTANNGNLNNSRVEEIRSTSDSGISSGRSTTTTDGSDILKEWGKPLGLPVVYTEGENGGGGGGAAGGASSTAVPGTPKKSASSASKTGTPAKTSSSGKRTSSRRTSRHSPIYVDLAYVPHHGNSHYCDSEFFRMIRGRYYVFSGLEPSREVFEGLLQGKQGWEDKNLETTIIPTYDTDTLGYWVVDSEKELAEAKIDLAPSASRCTINLQDHETSCAAYRLEF